MVGDSVKQVAIAVVRRQLPDGSAEFLVGRRGEQQTLAGADEFPGGGVAAGESTKAAALRECCEETGLRLSNATPLSIIEHEYDFGRLELHFFLCELEQHEFGTSLRSPFRWVPTERLDECSFPAANDSVLQLLKSGDLG